MLGSDGKGISIFLRILTVFLLVNVTTSSVLIYLAYNFNRNSIERRVEETIVQQIEIIRDGFRNSYRQNLERSLRFLTSSSALNDYLAAPEAEKLVYHMKLERVFLQALKDDETFRDGHFIDSRGHVTVDLSGDKRRRRGLNVNDVELGGSKGEVPPALKAVVDLYRDLEALPVLLYSGNMEWFMPPREMAVRGPFVGEDGRVSFLAGLAKIDLDTASFGGVMMIRQSLDGFLADLREVRFLDENPVWVFGPDGEVMQAPSEGRATFDPRGHMAAGYQGSLKLVSLSEGIVAYQDFAVVPGEPLLRIGIGLPSSLLLTDFFPAIRFFTLVLIGSLVAVFVVSLSVSRYLSKPIEQLAAAAHRLAGGDLQTRVPLRTTGEVQVLVDSFNQMAIQLRETSSSRDQSMRSLMKEVETRTQAERMLKQQAEELTSARIAAEAASKAKSEFLARMSHEIRTPMNGVIGMTELILAGQVSAKQRTFLDTIRRSGHTLLRLIDDILDFSKIEAGKMELEEIDFNLREAVEDVAELLATRAKRKGLELVCDIPLDLPLALRGDPHRLRQMLMNLTGNALKFTEQGEVAVRVARDEARDGARDGEIVLRFVVADTGVGIPAHSQQRVFDSFSQADGATTRRFGGTGLGLAITRQLAEMMGGSVGVESVEGRGSTFWFTARFRLADAAAARRAPATRELGGLRVLIVDDNATSCDCLARLVTAWGMTAEVASSSAQAVAATRAGQAQDIVLLDQDMPGLDGVALIDRLREGSGPPVPIILLTASEPGDPIGSVAGKAAACVTKPVRQSALFDCIAHVTAGDGTLGPRQADAPDETAQPLARLDARVLLADDNPINQVVAQEMLELLGCRARIVENGLGAVEAVVSSHFDLVLMDVQMPVMDGLEATRRIREWERLEAAPSRIPIIALTADAMQGDRDRCLDAGMDAYLTKPFTPSQLCEALQEVLPETGALAPDAAPDAAPARPEPAPAATASDALGEADAAIDQGALDNVRALQRPGAPSVLGKVIGIYLDRSPALLAALRDAVAAGEDAEAVRRAAHGFKSACANVGASGLAALCKRLEELGRSGETAGAAELTARLEAGYPRVRERLAALAGEPLHEALTAPTQDLGRSVPNRAAGASSGDPKP